ncbi:hypothetical protein A6A19_00750 [Actinobacillus delphinicola]|uniref:hypothetical protein n=1 Tax=Actinobacillus delphinicola TaxID=51161 RepID=UPI002441E0FC|nr:hypothetical protein [Actinobacillus delphinicola]MDG6896558.1 hypothetical protein [Actinobacillus delphinicola]
MKNNSTSSVNKYLETMCIVAVDRRISAFQGEVKSSNDYIEKHLGEISGNISNIKSVQQAYSTAIVNIEEIKVSINALRDSHNGLKSDFQVLNLDLKSDLQGLKSDLQGLKSDLQGLKSDLKSNSDEIKNKLEKISTDVKTTQSDIKQVKKAYWLYNAAAIAIITIVGFIITHWGEISAFMDILAKIAKSK